MSDHASTQELINKIEKKDKRFRLFQSLFMIGTFIALIFIIGAQQKTLESIQDQVEEQSIANATASKERSEQLASITRRLDCMVVFFSQPDRDNLTIEDVETCVLNKDQDLNKFFQNDPNNSSENPPNLPGSASTGTQENGPAQTDESEGQDTSEDSSPVTLHTPIVDIPLCVPLTGLCIRS